MSSAAPTVSAHSAQGIVPSRSMARRKRSGRKLGLAAGREHEETRVQHRPRARQPREIDDALADARQHAPPQQDLAAFRLAALQLRDHRLGGLAPGAQMREASRQRHRRRLRKRPRRMLRLRPVAPVAQRQFREFRQLRAEVGERRREHRGRDAPPARPRRSRPAPRAPASRRRAPRGSRTSGRAWGGSCGPHATSGRPGSAARRTSSPRSRSPSWATSAR